MLFYVAGPVADFLHPMLPRGWERAELALQEDSHVAQALLRMTACGNWLVEDLEHGGFLIYWNRKEHEERKERLDGGGYVLGMFYIDVFHQIRWPAVAHYGSDDHWSSLRVRGRYIIGGW